MENARDAERVSNSYNPITNTTAQQAVGRLLEPPHCNTPSAIYCTKLLHSTICTPFQPLMKHSGGISVQYIVSSILHFRHTSFFDPRVKFEFKTQPFAMDAIVSILSPIKWKKVVKRSIERGNIRKN
jgi:hypothetical protein